MMLLNVFIAIVSDQYPKEARKAKRRWDTSITHLMEQQLSADRAILQADLQWAYLCGPWAARCRRGVRRACNPTSALLCCARLCCCVPRPEGKEGDDEDTDGGIATALGLAGHDGPRGKAAGARLLLSVTGLVKDFHQELVLARDAGELKHYVASAWADMGPADHAGGGAEGAAGGPSATSTARAAGAARPDSKHSRSRSRTPTRRRAGRRGSRPRIATPAADSDSDVSSAFEDAESEQRHDMAASDRHSEGDDSSLDGGASTASEGEEAPARGMAEAAMLRHGLVVQQFGTTAVPDSLAFARKAASHAYGRSAQQRRSITGSRFLKPDPGSSKALHGLQGQVETLTKLVAGLTKSPAPSGSSQERPSVEVPQ